METQCLSTILGGLAQGQWAAETPAAGWTIGDQVTHLAYFDEAATLAALDEDAFGRRAAQLGTHGPDFSAWVAAQYRTMGPLEMRQWFQGAREKLIATFETLDPSARLPWYGPSMSVASCVTARLMETWAHGQDVADTLQIDYPQSIRLYHVAHLGVRTRSFSFAVHGLAPPDAPIRVILEAPDGSEWAWGDSNATELVTGPAVDFCYVVTQRRHLLDTNLAVVGPAAAAWLNVAQAFAGPPTRARPPAPGRP